jgi:thymidine phosphorylase
MHAKPGASLRGGDPLFTLHTDTPERFQRAIDVLSDAVLIAPDDARPDLPLLVIDRVG